ncbi:MAG TPA: dienelactone hydrolase [Myxococcales bacterium]|nr:dienelactone hydrolase [Myxococcales bacterium]
MTTPEALADFSKEVFTVEQVSRDVFLRGHGPAVLIVHEVPGITPEVAHFARQVADKGFTVALPSLFGRPGKPRSALYLASSLARACIRQEFFAFARHTSSPITDYLRGLGKLLHDRCGGPGIGFVGMCFTGNFALAMMADRRVLAPVLSQPSLPLAISPAHGRALHVSPQELQIGRQHAIENGCRPLALRFTGDPTVPAIRFASLHEQFGDAVELIEIDSSLGNPHGIAPWAHSVLTNDRQEDPDHPTQKAFERVIELFQQRLIDTQPI